MTTKSPRIGDVFTVNFNGEGHVQSGLRPAVIIQNNVGNVHSLNVIVLPLTSQMKKRNMPTHVLLKANESKLSRDSIVLCENPMTIPKNKLENFITELPEKCMEKIAIAHILSTSAIAFLNMDSIQELMDRATQLNK